MTIMKTKSPLMAVAMIAACAWVGSAFAAAEGDTARIERLEAAVAALEKRVSELEGLSIKSDPPKLKAAGDWKNRANWRLLKKGMTMDQVRSILGEPEKIDASGSFEHWYWKVPFGPKVIFYDDLVYGWEEK